MFCFKCGASMPDNAPACPKCGAAVAMAPPPPASAPAAAPAPAPVPVQGTPWLNIPRAQPYTGPQETDGKAVGSLVLGILALFPLGLLAGIPAVILGHLSRKSIRESLGRLKGEGMALAGLIMGYLSVAMIPIVLIIAAIAIPALLRAKIMANEQGSMSTVRTLNTAELTYSTGYPAAGYASSLAVLGPGRPPVDCTDSGNATQEHACLVAGTLGCTSAWCTVGPYRYNIVGICETGAACTDYVITATPVNFGATGSRSFCSTADGVIRAHEGRLPSAPTVEECQSWPSAT